MEIYAPMMGILWRVLETYGLEPSQAINPAYYQPGNKGNEQRRLSFEEFDEVQVRTLALCQDPAMGLRIAQVLNPSHFGALGHALLACDSLMSAFQIIQRYVRMANETVQAVITETGDTVKIRIEEGKQHSHPDLSADLALTSVLTMCRFIFGPQLVPQRVQLRRTRPDKPSPWFEVYGPGVQFAQAEDHLAFHIKDAQKPLTGSNQKLVKVHEDIMQRYLLRKDRDSVVNQARLGLMESLPSGRVTEEDLAASLHISKRTLHRKLRDQNLTFRTLLQDVRQDLAGKYLADENYSITEIAFLLGYTDTGAFSRACRRWFNKSPTELRSSPSSS